ncbi:hypothetical protein HK098_005942 [Nowakowskiella sp. JEL0407]|nr:hypothetical protein HK098_005942 [Nowakowskiella sp. JEL0407]
MFHVISIKRTKSERASSKFQKLQQDLFINTSNGDKQIERTGTFSDEDSNQAQSVTEVSIDGDNGIIGKFRRFRDRSRSVKRSPLGKSLPVSAVSRYSTPSSPSIASEFTLPSNDETVPIVPFLPRNHSANPSMHTKTFVEFTPTDLIAFQSAAFEEVNSIFKKHSLKLITPEVLRQIHQSNNIHPNEKKRWWALWKKEHEAETYNVMGVELIKSIQYASVPVGETNDGKRRIPILVHECVKYLREKGINNGQGLQSTGIFRVSGNERRINHLSEIFDTPPKYGLKFSFNGYNPHDVAALLKKYVRTLPEPIFPTYLYQYFVQCLDVPVNDGQRIRACRLLIMLLPSIHLVVFEYLLEFFSEIARYSVYNSMTVNNLARILATNFLRPKSSKHPLEDYERCSYLFELLVDQYDQFLISNLNLRPFEILGQSYLPSHRFYQPSPVPFSTEPYTVHSNHSESSARTSIPPAPPPKNPSTMPKLQSNINASSSSRASTFTSFNLPPSAVSTAPSSINRQSIVAHVTDNVLLQYPYTSTVTATQTTNGTSTTTTITTKITTPTLPPQRTSFPSSHSRSSSGINRHSSMKSQRTTPTIEPDTNVNRANSFSSKASYRKSNVSEHSDPVVVVVFPPMPEVAMGLFQQPNVSVEYRESDEKVERRKSARIDCGPKSSTPLGLRRVKTAPIKRIRQVDSEVNEPMPLFSNSK